jgi:hypothetical protein
VTGAFEDRKEPNLFRLASRGEPVVHDGALANSRTLSHFWLKSKKFFTSYPLWGQQQFRLLQRLAADDDRIAS